MDTKWIVSPVPAVQKINEMSKALGVSKLVAAILCVRDFSVLDAENFINKSNSCIYDPFLMKDMEKAVDRIHLAVKNNEKITIFGDYDADGVTATALLLKCIKSIGADADYYIPERETEGYGISLASVEIIKNRGTKLIITVDCGITAVDECECARNLGIDMIITDHHECGDTIPDAVAVIDCKQPDCNYPFKYLAGVGVAFKLSQALLQNKKSVTDIVDMFSDLFTIGSVADIVPLTGENRILCSYGLKNISSSCNSGLLSLMRVSGINKEEINTVKIGFGLAPRINAAGRLESAAKAIELFMTTDKADADRLADELNKFNLNRQTIEAQILEQAENMLDEHNMNDKVIVLSNENWHHGVVGIVSSRLCKKYLKPCIMISPGSDGNYKGSGRSLEGFSLYDALMYSKDTLISFGGHELAAGLVIDEKNIDTFRKTINEYADSHITDDILNKVITADCELRGRHLNIETANELSKLEPYGTGNEQPVFYIKHMIVQKVSYVGSNKQHLKLVVTKDGVSVNAIAFGMGCLDIKFNSVINVMCNLEINEFRNNLSLQLRIIDIK